MCSHGLPGRKSFVGDVRKGEDFKKMLDAVSFKKEVIIVATEDTEGQHLLLALNLYQEARYHGYDHMAMLVRTPKSCELMLQYEPGLSCFWDSIMMEEHRLGAFQKLCNSRIRIMVRAARLGYNALSLDSDMFILSDPYLHLKNGTLSNYQFLCPREGAFFSCNTGMMYLQNARVDGPATWMMYTAASMPLRIWDAMRAPPSNGSFNTAMEHLCVSDDQASVWASLVASAVGQLTFPVYSNDCCRKDWSPTVDGEVMDCKKANDHVQALSTQCALYEIIQVHPSPQAPLFQTFGPTPHASETYVGNLSIANSAWPASDYYGGRLFSSTPGSSTQRFHDQLKDDCPECPWWNENRPSIQEVSPVAMLHNRTLCKLPIEGQTPELYAAPPLWFTHSAAIYRHGYHAAPRAMVNKLEVAVIKHIHAWHLMVTGLQQKLNPRKVLGRYNWTLAEMVTNRTQASPYSSNRPITKVLALSPDIDLTRVRNWTEFSHIIAGLIQVALLSNRAPLMPDVPCESAWLHQDKTIKRACFPPIFPQGFTRLPNGFPYPVDDNNVMAGGWVAGFNESIPNVQQTFTGPQRYMVALPFLYDLRCTQGLHGVTLPEYHYWMSKRTERGEPEIKEPSDTNTIFRVPASGGAPGLSLSPPSLKGVRERGWPVGELNLPKEDRGWSLKDVQVALSAPRVVKELERLVEEPVIFLGHPVGVIPSKDQTKGATANAALEAVNSLIKNSQCKGTRMFPEDVRLNADDFEHSKPVSFDSTQPAYLSENGELVLASV